MEDHYEKSAGCYWKDLRQCILLARGQGCADCDSMDTKLRRTTFERGAYPLEEDVLFLCDDCHERHKPIPFYDEFIEAQVTERQARAIERQAQATQRLADAEVKHARAIERKAEAIERQARADLEKVRQEKVRQARAKPNPPTEWSFDPDRGYRERLTTKLKVN